MTSFTFGSTTVVMELDPLAPREYEKEQSFPCGYDTSGTAYAYDSSAPFYRTESLIFPVISWTNLQELISFIDNTLDGSYNIFTWIDRTTISRIARYKDISYEPISNTQFKVILVIEVLI